MNIPMGMPANAAPNTTATGATPTASAGATEAAPIADIFAALLGGLATPAATAADTPELPSELDSAGSAATDSGAHDGSDASETVLAMSQFAAMFNPQSAIPNLAPETNRAGVNPPTSGETQVLTDSAMSSPTNTQFANPVDLSTAPTSAAPPSATASAPTPSGAIAASVTTANATTNSTPAAMNTAVATPEPSEHAHIKGRAATSMPIAAVEVPVSGHANPITASTAVTASVTPTPENLSAGIADTNLPKPLGRMKLDVAEVDTNAATQPLAVNPDELVIAAAAHTSATPAAFSVATKSSDDSISINATATNAHAVTNQTSRPLAAAGPEATTPSTPLAPATQQVLEAIEPMARRADGTYHLKLSLNPHELGRVELSIELRDGMLAVHMTADRPETQRVLNEQLGKLREILDDRGVSMGSLDVGDHSARNAFSAQAQFQDRNSDERRDRATASSTTANTTPSTGLPPIRRQSPSTNLFDVHA